MHSLDVQELPNSAFHREKMIFHILAYRTLKFLVSFRSVSFRFVSFRCAKYSKPFLGVGGNRSAQRKPTEEINLRLCNCYLRFPCILFWFLLLFVLSMQTNIKKISRHTKQTNKQTNTPTNKQTNKQKLILCSIHGQ